MNRLYPFRKALALFAIWWLAWAFIEGYILWYYGTPVATATVDSILHIVLLLLAFVIIYNKLRFYKPKRGNRLYMRLLWLAYAWCITSLHAGLLRYLFPAHADFIHQALPIRIVFSLIMTGLSTLAA